ncbi:hypothetical protein EON63_17750 [archaeon]|nr:MAG: hypothetical protein EON63_17750 [archaeon]
MQEELHDYFRLLTVIEQELHRSMPIPDMPSMKSVAGKCKAFTFCVFAPYIIYHAYSIYHTP